MRESKHAWDVWQRHDHLAMVVVRDGDLFAERGIVELIEAWMRRNGLNGKIEKGGVILKGRCRRKELL